MRHDAGIERRCGGERKGLVVHRGDGLGEGRAPGLKSREVLAAIERGKLLGGHGAMVRAGSAAAGGELRLRTLPQRDERRNQRKAEEQQERE
jgi:hypothetical protein